MARTPNRLENESSPYLRQHAYNPVDWFPWGSEAFEKARREDKPVFLSIGYSACHWCHVMERESFESEEIARVLNERFVSIKVDREERPDVDDVYMTAVQLTTGRGGWPLTSFLLPDGRPFFGGTYFPPDDRGSRTGFRSLLLRVDEAWREKREEIEETALRLSEELVEQTRVAEKLPARRLDAAALDVLTVALRRAFDARHGGFGSAPKFPPHGALEWLIGRAEAGDPTSREMAEKTLEAMALGGIHDHLAGGFHRYATDEIWLVPHFEKMLYDNAQLLGLYARGSAVFDRELFRRTSRGIAEYLLTEMRGEEGAFHAATDADSEGEEGKYFVFTEKEILEVLGPGDGAFFGRLHGVRKGGNYHDEATGRATGTNILHLASDPAEDEEARLRPLREKLLSVRRRRVPPALDDKRLAGWNALAVSGFAIAARVLEEPRYLAAARATVRFLLETSRDDSGRLLRTWKDGAGKIPAFLEDEAYLVNALLDLAEAEAVLDPPSSDRTADEARRALASLRSHFGRDGQPGFTFSGTENETLLTNGRDLFDKATPSASGSAARALVRTALRFEDRGLAAEARAMLDEVSGLLHRSPHGLESWFLALGDVLEFEKRFGAPVDSATASAASGPVRVEACLTPRKVGARDGAGLVLKVQVRDGYHLPEEGGLVLEAWAGSDVSVTWVELPKARALPGGIRGHDGAVAARADVLAAPTAARGDRSLLVLARTRACGEGVCLPDAIVSLTIPIQVGGAA